MHFDKADKGGQRKRKGGTVTPFGVRCGDRVMATKSGETVIGWVGGYTQTAKSKNISVYDHNWKRLGQSTEQGTAHSEVEQAMCSVTAALAARVAFPPCALRDRDSKHPELFT